MATDDDELKGVISTDMLNDGRLSGIVVHVSVENGVVFLDGSVQSYRRKLLAHEIASCYAGVCEVVNRLRVEPTSPIADEVVIDCVRAALDASADITKQTIVVESHGGKVTLRGNVGGHWERVIAEDISLSVRGVREVQNLLVVDLTERIDDQEASEIISKSLNRACGLGGTNIHVAVSHDLVVLSGQVPQLAHKEMAQKVAERVGIAHIRNDISVRPAESSAHSRAE